MFANFMAAIKNGGLPLLFVLLLLEGNPIIGSFIPGQVLVIFIGFLISTTGYFPLIPTIIVVFLGGFIGDILGYYFSKKWGIEGMKKFGLDPKSTFYRSSCNFFKKFGGWSIILGREFNFTRSFMPFFAAVFKMPKKKFIALAAVSNAIWALLSVLLGYYFGYIVAEKIEFAMEFIFLLLAYFIIIYIIYKGLDNFFAQNYSLIRKYALMNIIHLGFVVGALIALIFLNDWEYAAKLNDYFAFLYMPVIGSYFAPMLSFHFLLFFMFILLLLLIYYRKYRQIAVLVWVFILTSFANLFFTQFSKIWFNLTPYISIIFLTVMVFYSSSLIARSRRLTLKKKIFFDFLLALGLITAMLIKFSLTQNFFLILYSFFLAALQCEFIVLLSHYKIITRSLSDSLNHEAALREALSFKK